MDRQLASIQRISKIEDISGADNIKRATILGWEVVIRKEEFKEQDLCVYCEIDSILPARPEFDFLKDRKYRIKTIRLRGQISQGICFPLCYLPPSVTVSEGMDVTDIIGVTKYLSPSERAEQEDVERRVNTSKNRIDKFFKRYKWYRNLFFKPAKRKFPEWITKTDEERVQNFPDVCEKYKDVPFEVTEKLDGQSATYFIIKRKPRMFWQSKWIFGVCSRNLHLTKPNNSTWWTITKKYNICNQLRVARSLYGNNINSLVVQGEIIGPGIQANKYDLTEIDLYVFGVYIDGIRGDSNAMWVICNFLGLRPVPSLAAYQTLPDTISELVEFSKAASYINPNIPREGLVYRGKDIHFKVVNPEFLLKYGE